MKILIAEDEEIMKVSLQNALEGLGYEVTAACDGNEAMKLLNSGTFDLVITDILMPYTSGLELIGIIKANRTISTPVMVLSTLGGQEEIVLAAFDMGADDFITKPFKREELNIRVKRLLKKKNVTEEEEEDVEF